VSGTDDSIAEIASHEKRATDVLCALLHWMSSESPDELLREMATDVLEGRIRLREAVLSEIYGSHLLEEVERFCVGYESLDTGERRDLIRVATEYLD
jgi:hypothetical protein